MADIILEPSFVVPHSVTNKPSETCISRDTFKRLPLEIQRGYALYHGVSEANRVTSEVICAALYTTNEWIPVADIEGHIKLGTSRGFHVVMNAMDLVDILAGVETDEQTPLAAHLSDVAGSSATPSDWVWNLVGMLEEQHRRVKAAIEDSQRQAQEAAADTFEFQAKLSKETRYHTGMVTTMADFVGVEATERYEVTVHKHRHTHSNANRAQKQSMPKYTNTPGALTPTPTPADTTPLRRSQRHKPLPSPNSRMPTASLPTSKIPYEESNLEPRRSSLKRPSDEDSVEEELPDTTSTIRPTMSIHPPKKRRLAARRDSAPGAPVEDTDSSSTIEVKWIDYPSDDTSNNSSSYIPSNRTESVVTDRNTRAAAKRYHMEDINPYYASTDRDSSPEIIVNGVPWNSYRIDGGSEGSETDGDYIPPSFDREWLREWIPGKRHRYRFYHFEEYHYIEDCIDNGLLSDCGLSTDDSEYSYYDKSTLRRTRWQTCKSLGPDGQHEYANWIPRTSVPVEEMTPNDIEVRKQDRWRDLQYRLKSEPEWVDCDIEARVFDTLEPDHFVFDDQEWKFFENHSFNEPFEHRTIVP